MSCAALASAASTASAKMVASLCLAEWLQPARGVALAAGLVLSMPCVHDVSRHAMARYLPKVQAGTDASAPTSNGPRNLRFAMHSPPIPNSVAVPCTNIADTACHTEIIRRQCREGSCQCGAQIAKFATPPTRALLARARAKKVAKITKLHETEQNCVNRRAAIKVYVMTLSFGLW